MTKSKTATALLIFVFSVASALSAAKPARLKPLEYQPEIAGLVSTYLSYYHFGKKKIDNRASQQILQEYIESLDPTRMFFLQADIEGFQKYAGALDDQLKSNPPNLDAPFAIFNRYKQRVHERVDAILALLDKEYDFTKDEYFHYDREEMPWATTPDELDEIWRKRLKEEMVRFELREKPQDEYQELLVKRYERMRKNLNEWEAPDVLERFLSSVATTFDPHSSYLKPATKDNFDIQMGHSLEGIGATLTRDGEYTKVVDIVTGGPADRGGELKVGDRIIAVGQGDKKAEDVVDLRLDKVVKQIRGPKGTKVRLTVIPVDAAVDSETNEISIIRDHVEITSADAKSEIKEIKTEYGEDYRVGVIEIPSFYLDSDARYKGDPNYKSTTRDVRKLLDELEDQDVDGLVIDLRQNGGGSLDEAVQLTGLFIHSGPVVQIRGVDGKSRIERDPDPKQVYEGPLLVLTSVFSASASEIFSSAIQDYGRGIVVGGKSTHGKGTVQNVFGLQRSLSSVLKRNFEEDVAGALKLTTYKFYRVSGGSTQFRGVRPDIVLPSPYDGLDVTEADLDYALPWDEIEPVPHKTYDLVRESLPYLRTNSGKRITDNPEFHYLKEDLDYRAQREERNKVSLNLEKRRAEKDDLEKIEERRKEERKTRLSLIVEDLVAKNDKEEEEEDEVIIPDYILNESLFILRDFIDFKGNRIAATPTPAKKESL